MKLDRICNVPQDNSVIKIGFELLRILQPEACKDDPDLIWSYEILPLTPDFDPDAMEVTINWGSKEVYVLGVEGMPPQNADFSLNFYLPNGQTVSTILETVSVGECANAFFTVPQEIEEFRPKIGYRNPEVSFGLPEFTGETNCPFEFTMIEVKPVFPVYIEIDGDTVKWTGPLDA